MFSLYSCPAHKEAGGEADPGLSAAAVSCPFQLLEQKWMGKQQLLASPLLPVSSLQLPDREGQLSAQRCEPLVLKHSFYLTTLKGKTK